MRPLRRFGFLCALALLAGARIAAAQSLRAVPLDHWSYSAAEEILLRHPEWGEGLHLAARPWREQDFTALIERARDGGLGADDPARPFVDLLAETFRPDSGPQAARGVTMHNEVALAYQGYAAKDDASFDPPFLPARFGKSDEDSAGHTGRPAHRVMAGHDFGVQYLDRFALGWRYVVDSHVKSDPTRFRQLEVRKGEDYGFALLDAYGTYHYGPLYFTIGRNELSFGPGRASSPFLSDSIPPLDHARIELDTRTFHFTGLVARLSGDFQNRMLDEIGQTIPGSLPPDSNRIRTERLLYLHRVDWQPHTMVQLGVSEAALVSGIDRHIEFRYANLLMPFFVTQEDEDEPEGRNVNVMVDVDGALTFRRVRVYGLFMAQEFFIDKTEREKIGNQTAWRIGGSWADPLGIPGVTAGAEYTRADVFMYLHRGLNTNWTTYGVPLGSMLGPDADQTLAWVSWYPCRAARLTVQGFTRRGGENSVETQESVLDAGNPPFPRGVVQQEVGGSVEGWVLLPRWGLEGLARATVRQVDDVGNEVRADERFWQLDVGLRYAWRFR